jgi:putative ABC transport system permease protein
MTNVIGIKKALGARRTTILLEFLIESVILCVIGGVAGLALITGLLKILTSALKFEMFLSLNNILLGLFISTVVGIISGIIPAIQASRLNPVVAIRK